MTLRPVLFCTFFFSTMLFPYLVHGQDKTKVCHEAFQRMECSWSGSQIIVSPTGLMDSLRVFANNRSEGDTILHIYTNSSIMRIDSLRFHCSADAKSVMINQDSWLITLAVNDGNDIIMVLERKGKENGKDCQFRSRYTIGLNNYYVKKDVRHFGETDFSLRESLNMTKVRQ